MDFKTNEDEMSTFFVYLFLNQDELTRWEAKMFFKSGDIWVMIRGAREGLPTFPPAEKWSTSGKKGG
jgi:hypothetical protein